MLAIKRIHMDYETDPVGVEGMPQFGWEIVCVSYADCGGQGIYVLSI